jgi:hypothetical protein
MFGDGTIPLTLKLVDSKVSKTGVLHGPAVASPYRSAPEGSVAERVKRRLAGDVRVAATGRMQARRGDVSVFA